VQTTFDLCLTVENFEQFEFERGKRKRNIRWGWCHIVNEIENNATMTEITERNVVARALMTAFEAGCDDLKRFRDLCAVARRRTKKTNQQDDAIVDGLVAMRKDGAFGSAGRKSVIMWAARIVVQRPLVIYDGLGPGKPYPFDSSRYNCITRLCGAHATIHRKDYNKKYSDPVTRPGALATEKETRGNRIRQVVDDVLEKGFPQRTLRRLAKAFAFECVDDFYSYEPPYTCAFNLILWSYVPAMHVVGMAIIQLDLGHSINLRVPAGPNYDLTEWNRDPNDNVIGNETDKRLSSELRSWIPCYDSTFATNLLPSLKTAEERDSVYFLLWSTIFRPKNAAWNPKAGVPVDWPVTPKPPMNVLFWPPGVAADNQYLSFLGVNRVDQDGVHRVDQDGMLLRRKPRAKANPAVVPTSVQNVKSRKQKANTTKPKHPPKKKPKKQETIEEPVPHAAKPPARAKRNDSDDDDDDDDTETMDSPNKRDSNTDVEDNDLQARLVCGACRAQLMRKTLVIGGMPVFYDGLTPSIDYDHDDYKTLMATGTPDVKERIKAHLKLIRSHYADCLKNGQPETDAQHSTLPEVAWYAEIKGFQAAVIKHNNDNKLQPIKFNTIKSFAVQNDDIVALKTEAKKKPQPVDHYAAHHKTVIGHYLDSIYH